jgi:amino acid adenylation domain-containing protein
MSTAVDPPSAFSPEARRALLAEQFRLVTARSQSSPLSFAQQRLWFLDQLEPNSPRYNMLSVARLTGTLDLTALEQALNAIVARHETLRTRIVCTDGEPEQVIDEAVSLTLQRRDLSGVDESDREAELERMVREEVSRPFNLGTDRLLRVTVLRLQAEEHVLVLNIHHIVSDEWSFGIFFDELAAFYAGFVAGKPVSLPELPIQYSDYAVWQRDWLQGELCEKQLGFWREQLRGNPSAVELPTDHPRTSTPTSRGAGRCRALGQDLSAALKQLANRERATLFMVLLAAFKVLLYRYTRQEDIIVGSPMAGRTRMETEGLIGFFVNTLPLRARLSGDLSFLELLAQVREVALGAYSHQDVPFERLVQELHPERAAGQTPFMKVLFLARTGISKSVEFPGLKTEFLGMGTDTAKFDLTLGVQETEHGLVAGIEYSADLFDDATIARLLEHYEVLLQGIVTQPARRISELPLLGETERRQLLVEWNDTQTGYPRNRCVHELFEAQAAQSPEAVAVSFGELQLTYAELNARANQLAHYLARVGVRPGRVVGICAGRSLEMLVGLLAILKAGGAYAALDPASPKERLAYMLEDLRVPVVLTQHHLTGVLPDASARNATFPPPLLIFLDADWQVIARENADNPHTETCAENLAYVSFTSGSTGRPKGVCVPHRGVVRLVKSTNYARFSSRDVFLQLAPVSFDASTFEIWGCLLNGARLVMLPPQTPSLSELAEAIQKHRVTTAWFTTGLFNQIIEEKPEGLKPLRQILTGGDVLSPPHIRKALSALVACRLINGYGPTENTTFTTCYPIPADFDGERSVPIGRPVSNTQCYVLDDRLQPVPIGVPGELYTGGDGLASGYLNQPEQTAKRFVPNPFQPGSRLYRTGDLVRYLADGNIEFLGRIDLQVKIRGFRVELGEIESMLLQHPGVRQCVVLARAEATGVKQLVAYVVPRKNPAPPAEDWQNFLRQLLPEYMVPALFVTLGELPLSANGKVDRPALPAPKPTSIIADGQIAPRDEVERGLQQLWEAILDVRPIGVRDKFFTLGGHSLLAVRLLARVEKKFGQKLSVATLFQNPTIEQLAVVLRGASSPNPGSTIVEIQPQGTKQPLLLVHGAGGGMFWGYSNLSRHLGLDQPVFAFESRGLNGQEEFESIEAMAQQYVTDLRSFQRHGPYYLGGYCFGGIVAYEMARQLQAQGEQVALLALINSSPPNSSYTRFRWTPASTFKFAKNFCVRGACSLVSTPNKPREYLRWKARFLGRRLRELLFRPRAEMPEASIDELVDLSQYPEDQRKLWHAHVRALINYHPQLYQGQVTLFHSPVHLLFCSFDPKYGWSELASGGVEVNPIPGDHETIMEEPHVHRLAEAIHASLAKAQVVDA